MSDPTSTPAPTSAIPCQSLPDHLPSHLPHHLPHQRWYLFPPTPEQAATMASTTGLSPLLAQVLINREIATPEQAETFLNPESLILPSPTEAFPDLNNSVDFLQDAILHSHKIAICGDYDADGMTSTALLLRALSTLGANVDYAIPSRMREGYGINHRIVEEFHQEGVQLILTVDNGIAAYEPIARARELGLTVIVTDHHDLPPQLPPANAILNPKLIPESSPYRGLAGVGVAYVLAITLAQRLNKVQGLVNPLLELFTLGTIADLAPLTGVNRRWVKRGLQRLPHSQLAGIKALIQVSGREQENADAQQLSLPLAAAKNAKSMKPEEIGFRLGPRINAVGRLDDPQIVIELLTTDDPEIALKRAKQCEQINQRRQLLCEEIEQEAIQECEQFHQNLQQERVLVLIKSGWHHGVIGIVASRLVERYGVPVFIGTYEDEPERNDSNLMSVKTEEHEETEENKLAVSTEITEEMAKVPPEMTPPVQHSIIRGSARSIPEFHVFEALQFCHDLLTKFGGHKAAGGFSFPANNLAAFRLRLQEFAHQCLQPEHLKPLVSIDVEAALTDLTFDLYRQIDSLHPCGIENKAPIFWTPNVQILDQRVVGKGHLKLTLLQNDATTPSRRIQAIAWRWGDYYPLPPWVDLAYQLRENTWNGNTTIELEVVGVRLPSKTYPPISPEPLHSAPIPKPQTEFYYRERQYSCSVSQTGEIQELRIKNDQGQILAVQQGKATGLLGMSRDTAREVNVSEPHFYDLIKAAMEALKYE